MTPRVGATPAGSMTPAMSMTGGATPVFRDALALNSDAAGDAELWVESDAELWVECDAEVCVLRAMLTVSLMMMLTCGLVAGAAMDENAQMQRAKEALLKQQVRARVQEWKQMLQNGRDRWRIGTR
eukprot:2598173-Rhodomonas_salina.1